MGSRSKADAIRDVESWFSQIRKGAYEITSDYDAKYNCAAFAAGETDVWWEPIRPDGYWPPDAPHEFTIEAYATAYRSVGFEICESSNSEPGFEKLALYGEDGEFVHAALQLPSGRWTSKLGRSEDIEHDTLEQLEGKGKDEYGFVVAFMKRPKA